MNISTTGSGMTRPARRRHIWINADRVLYAGLIGQRSTRVMGSIVLYVALAQPIRISIGNGEWVTTHVAVVQPYTPHKIDGDNQMTAVFHLEPETVIFDMLPAYLKAPSGAVLDTALLQAVRAAYARIDALGNIADPQTSDFDQFFWGRTLPRPELEARIAIPLEHIKRNPCGQASASACAQWADLSVSRFLHLFRASVGVPFRRFRSWKRGRSLLYRLLDTTDLVYLALDAGYPDSTHFSHSVRQLYGMTPTLLLKNCHQISMYGPAAPPRHSG